MTDAALAERPLHELHARHAELIAKGNGNPKDLSDTDLEELVGIFAALRRRSSGPPSAKKKTASSTEGKPLDELL